MRFSRTWLLFIALAASLTLALTLGACAVEVDPPTMPGIDWIIDEPDATFTSRTGTVFENTFINPNAKLTIKDSTLYLDKSLTVNPQGTLILQNATLIFICSLDYPNSFDVAGGGTVTISDKDSNPDTTYDGSLITSDSEVYFNITVFQNATFTMRNSAVSKCGRYSNDDFYTEGIYILADSTIIEGCNISSGYYGLVLDQPNNVILKDNTITDCTIGIRLSGTRDVRIENCTVKDCTVTGIEVRGHNANLAMSQSRLSGSGQADLYMRYTSGFSNVIEENVIGPSTGKGAWIEECTGYDFLANTVTGCSVGFDLSASTVEVHTLAVVDCIEGLLVARGGSVVLENLTLTRTTVTVEPSTYTNITTVGTVVWTEVVGDLGCRLVVTTQAKMILDEVDLGFTKSRGRLVGIDLELLGTLRIVDSTLGSPTSGAWFCHFKDGSTVRINTSTMSDLGSASAPLTDRGLFLDCDGAIDHLTIQDSVVGIIVGRTTARVTNVTVTDCETGVLADGELSHRGLEIFDFTATGCDVVARVTNTSMLTINSGDIDMAAEGFNVSERSSLTLRDCVVGDPATGEHTAHLYESSTLSIVNSTSSRVFLFGAGDNLVSIYWYLNLTLRFLSDGSPMAGAMASAEELTGGQSVQDVLAGPDGVIRRMELRELSLTPDTVMGTPHTITVSHGGREDHFSITMDRSKDHTFYLDNFPPELTVTSPSTGSRFNDSTVSFEGTARDSVVTDHEGLASLSYRVDNGTWLPIPLPAVVDWSIEIVLTDGPHVVYIEVVDKIGNRNTTTVMLEIDTTAPLLVITFPDLYWVTKDTELEILGTSEPGAVVTVDGVQTTLSPTGDFAHTVTLEVGTNTIVVVATDDLGNSRTRTIIAEVDNEPPEVLFDHTGPWVTNETGFELTGDKETNTSLTVNGVSLPQFFGSDRFSVTIDLHEGQNSIAIESVDTVANRWTTTLVIVLDTRSPVLNVKSVPGYTSSPVLTIQGTVDDATASVTANGQAVVLSGQSFVHQVSLAEGANTITLVATDPIGNAGDPVVLEVTLDTQPPSLTIHMASFTRTLKSNQTLEGSTDPGATVIVNVVNGPYSRTYNAVAGNDGSFKFDIIIPQLGNHTITVIVEDLAGNRNSGQLHVLRVHPDNGGPVTPDGGPSWLEDNWAWLVLAASLVASGLVLAIAFKPRKRRAPPRAAQPPSEDEGTDEEGEYDEEEEYDEGNEADHEEGDGEEWEEGEEERAPED